MFMGKLPQACLPMICRLLRYREGAHCDGRETRVSSGGFHEEAKTTAKGTESSGTMMRLRRR